MTYESKYRPVPPVPEAPPLPDAMEVLAPADDSPEELATDELNPEEKLAAVLEGTRRFKTGKEIAEHLGRTKFWFYQLRKKQSYRDLVQAVVADIARRMTEAAADVGAMFDSQIKPSVETLIEVRDNPFEKAGDRIKASLGLIDHAPSAPRAKEAANASLVLQIPFPQLEGIKEALADEGEGELIELLEGEDFSAVHYNEPPPPGEDFRVPVREID